MLILLRRIEGNYQCSFSLLSVFAVHLEVLEHCSSVSISECGFWPMALGASILYSSDGPIMENTHNSQSKQKSLKYRKTNQPKLSASPLLLMQRNYQRRLLEEKEKKLAELCRKREEEALRHVAQNCSKDVKHYFQQTHNDTTLRESTWSSNSQRTKKLPPIKFTENKSRSFHGDAETNDSDDFSRRPNVGEKGKRRKLKGFSVGHTVFENGTTSIKRFDGSDGGTLQPQNKENEDTMLPDMTNLKSKILARKRQLQKVNKRHANLESSNLDANASDDQKLVTAQRTLTDFQKWQMQQDMERTERLKNHALKNMRSPRNQLESEESVSDSTSTAGFSKPHQNSRSRRKPSNQGLAGAKKAPGNHPQASHRQFANKESVHNQGKETSHALGAQDAVKGETNEGTEQIRLDLTYSKQHGLSEQMRAFRNNNRIKESRQNEHLQSMAGFHKPVLVRHDSHSTGSSRTSTRTGISPQVATQDRHANDKKYEENWKGPVQTRETDYGNDNVRVGEKLGMVRVLQIVCVAFLA